MNRLLMTLLSGFVLAACAVGANGADKCENRGFLDRPPVYVPSEPDFPLTGMGVAMPAPGILVPDVDLSDTDSDGFNENGVNVQPALNLRMSTYRLGAMRGFDDGWAGAVSIPWVRNRVTGGIGGLPATGVGDGLGDIAVFAKKTIWADDKYTRAVASFGLELPTGKDNATFAQDNAVTNGYYTGGQHRMPLGWQAGDGAVNGYLAVAYGRRMRRISYVGLVATKLHASGDDDVKIGDILIASVNATYGVARSVAVSLGLTFRTQGNDSYPNAPPPGVQQPALAGTTTHSPVLFIDPSVRFNIANRVTVGIGLRYPIMKPDAGMVPEVNTSFIFYPELF